MLTRPKEFDVIATLNLNGDYLSDALAAQVGGIGIAPGGNINYVTGHAIFEATHGTAPKYAEPGQGQPRLASSSRGEMMLRYLGWTEAADLILKGLNGAIAQQARHLRLRPPDGRRDGNQVLASSATTSSRTCRRSFRSRRSTYRDATPRFPVAAGTKWIETNQERSIANTPTLETNQECVMTSSFRSIPGSSRHVSSTFRTMTSPKRDMSSKERTETDEERDIPRPFLFSANEERTMTNRKRDVPSPFRHGT